MEPLLITIAVAASLILAGRLCTPLFQKYMLKKSLDRIEELRKISENLIRLDIDEAEESLRKWHDGDKVTRDFCSEEELATRIKRIHEDKQHEDAIYERLLRGLARFSNERNQLAKVVVAYTKYMDTKVRQHRDSRSLVRALNCGGVSFEEFHASARQTQILLEESERELNLLVD